MPVGHTFPQPTAAAEPVRLALAAACWHACLGRAGRGGDHLTLAGITDAPGRQLTLFDLTADDNRARLDRDPGPSGGALRGGRLPAGTLADPDNLLPERRAVLQPWQ